MLEVIVGQTFLARSRRIGRQHARAPAAGRSCVTTTTCCRCSGSARRKVDFPVLVPVVARGAVELDYRGAGPRLHGRRAGTRSGIVYQRGFGDYWGIQQTSWTDAPILQGASVERGSVVARIGSSTSGSKLHMVAFEENGAVYWVSNTLLRRALERDDARDRQGLQASVGGRSE